MTPSPGHPKDETPAATLISGSSGSAAKITTAGGADLRERVSDARGYSPRNLKYLRAMAAARWSSAAATVQWVVHLK